MNYATRLFNKLAEDNRVEVGQIVDGGYTALAAAALDKIFSLERHVEHLVIAQSEVEKELDRQRELASNAERRADSNRNWMTVMLEETIFGQIRDGMAVLPPKAIEYLQMDAPKKIDAIKVVRQAWGLGLLEAKTLVETYMKASQKVDEERQAAEAERLRMASQEEIMNLMEAMGAHPVHAVPHSWTDDSPEKQALIQALEDQGPTKAQVDALRDSGLPRGATITMLPSDNPNDIEPGLEKGNFGAELDRQLYQGEEQIARLGKEGDGQS